MAITNLPYNIQFKHKNMLIVEILSRSSETSLHKINNYLSPIVDELESIWNKIKLSLTAENKEGKTIRVALVLVSCDTLAARKICGHVSALILYYRCKKKANYNNN